ncbi:copper resistance protein CopC [Micromonospora sp. 15K316]|uniref:copper resistance CopC family protein n=1 Tax=Micromonospora sp. 15K316 TaxID=2530376 RepID=UPI00104E285C|nr:copper resistance CopC family protein [Micromonospora sp. 15K316]TDC39158.1 copper resistance protein CopC [Micromonospora sp. 15K316]
MSTRSRRPIAARVAALLTAVAVLVAPAAPAAAHNALRASEPAAAAHLSAPPTRISLTFLQKLDPAFTTIVLSDAGRRKVPTGAPVVTEATGTVTIDGPLVNGTYTVAYRVVSADGHPVQGSYSFTVDDPAASGAPVVAAPDSAGPTAAASGRSTGPGPWPLAAGALIVIVVAGGAVLLRRRRATA